MTATSNESGARIFSAAEELFAARGFDGVSVRDIAERAGVNKALVFYYYGNKAGLFERILERYYGAHADALTGALGEGGSLQEQLHGLLDAYLDFIEENRRYIQLVQREIALGSDSTVIIQKGLGELYDRVAAILAGVAPDKGPMAIRQFFISFAGLVTNYFLYAPVLEHLWGSDPMSIAHRRERREHLHWMVDRIADGLADNPSAT